MNRVFLGLGSNLKDRKENLQAALSCIASIDEIKIKNISSIYKTSPIGPSQRNFYNVIVEISTRLNCYDLLIIAKNIEHALGRKKTIRWGDRIIDIDILCSSSEIINTPELAVPHKEIANRLFVLMPMCEIAASFIHPILHKSFKKLLKERLPFLDNQKIKEISS
jgi:2-amino-4-hydroxy-6-hydroxymethyldihydropteridine diphosphokinase